jgi:mono/diheme cytochrome c family protein
MTDTLGHCMRREFPHWTLGVMVMASVLSITPFLGQESTAPVRRGESLLAENCARCHAIGTSGSSPHNEAPPFRTLSRKYQIEGLGEALAEGLSVGHPDMPEFVFEPDDVGAILDYLKSIQQP